MFSRVDPQANRIRGHVTVGQCAFCVSEKAMATRAPSTVPSERPAWRSETPSTWGTLKPYARAHPHHAARAAAQGAQFVLGLPSLGVSTVAKTRERKREVERERVAALKKAREVLWLPLPRFMAGGKGSFGMAFEQESSS